ARRGAYSRSTFFQPARFQLTSPAATFAARKRHDSARRNCHANRRVRHVSGVRSRAGAEALAAREQAAIRARTRARMGAGVPRLRMRVSGAQLANLSGCHRSAADSLTYVQMKSTDVPRGTFGRV